MNWNAASDIPTGSVIVCARKGEQVKVGEARYWRVVGAEGWWWANTSPDLPYADTLEAMGWQVTGWVDLPEPVL